MSQLHFARAGWFALFFWKNQRQTNQLACASYALRVRADSCRLSPVTRRVAGSSPVVPTVDNHRRDVAQLVEHLVYLDTLSALLSIETYIFSGPMRLGCLTPLGCFRGASAERPAELRDSRRVERSMAVEPRFALARSQQGSSCGPKHLVYRLKAQAHWFESRA